MEDHTELVVQVKAIQRKHVWNKYWYAFCKELGTFVLDPPRKNRRFLRKFLARIAQVYEIQGLLDDLGNERWIAFCRDLGCVKVNFRWASDSLRESFLLSVARKDDALDAP